MPHGENNLSAEAKHKPLHKTGEETMFRNYLRRFCQAKPLIDLFAITKTSIIDFMRDARLISIKLPYQPTFEFWGKHVF